MKWLVFCLLCCACASKQKISQQHAVRASSEKQQERLSFEKVGFSMQHWQNDSSQLREQVLIYPEGRMEFGPKGFVGQAKAILWLRQQNQQQRSATNWTATKEVQQKEQVKEVAKVQEEQKLSWQQQFSLGKLHWVFFILLLIVAAAYWFWRKR